MSIVKNLLRNKKSLAHHLEQAAEEYLQELKKLNAIQSPKSSESVEIKRIQEELDDFTESSIQAQHLVTGSGWGCYLEMRDGSVKIDCGGYSEFGLFGAGNERILKKKIELSIGDFGMNGSSVFSESCLDVVRSLVLSVGGQFSKGKLYSGSNQAHEAALRMIRYHQFPAGRLLAFEDSCLGDTGYLTALSDVGAKENLMASSEVFWLKRNPGNTEEALEDLQRYLEKFGNQIAALVIDSTSFYGGLRELDALYMQSIVRICKEYGIIVWLNEVDSDGFINGNELFRDVDLLSISGSLPTAALLCSENVRLDENRYDVADRLKEADVKLSLFMLDEIKNAFGVNANNLHEKEKEIKKKANSLLKSIGKTKGLEISTNGATILLKEGKADPGFSDQVFNVCFDAGLLVRKGMQGGQIILQFPLVVMSIEEIEQVFEILESALISVL